MYQRGGHHWFVVARLKDTVTPASADSELKNITDRLAKEFPETNNGWDAYLVPLHEQVIGDVKTALWILPIAVGFVLLIACANVANCFWFERPGDSVRWRYARHSVPDALG